LATQFVSKGLFLSKNRALSEFVEHLPTASDLVVITSKMTTDISNKIENELTVLLCKEYGYREWFWFPEMSEEKLIQWWKDLESVEPYFMTPERLPGTLIQVKEDNNFELF